MVFVCTLSNVFKCKGYYSNHVDNCLYIYCNLGIRMNKKVKQSRYRPGVTQRVLGS